MHFEVCALADHSVLFFDEHWARRNSEPGREMVCGVGGLARGGDHYLDHDADRRNSLDVPADGSGGGADSKRNEDDGRAI